MSLEAGGRRIYAIRIIWDTGMKNLIAAVLLLCYGSVQAATITIAFDEYASELGNTFSVVESQGFRFQKADGELFIGYDEENDPLLHFYSGAEQYTLIEMAAMNGSAFNVVALDFSIMHPSDPITIRGNFVGGGTIELVLPSYTGSINAYHLDSSWVNLESVEFMSATGIATVDNIVVSSVPIPAAVWLFGSALGGLGWMRGRKTV
jgi:hypothetical protein